MNETQRDFNKLRAAANRAQISANPTIFFPLLHTFSLLLLQSKPLRPVLQRITDKEKTARTYLAAFTDKALNELRSISKKIKVYILSCQKPNEDILRLLEEFDQNDKEDSPLNSRLFTYLERALSMLANDEDIDHSNFLKTFGEIKQINDYKYFDTRVVFFNFFEWLDNAASFTQYQQRSDWFSVNQIAVFAERYDIYHYTKMTKELQEKGIDTIKLQKEHMALMNYAYYNGGPSSLLPTVEEYKCHIMKIVDSIADILEDSLQVTEYRYNYDPDTGELKIEDIEPISFKINESPAKLLKKIVIINQSKPASYISVFKFLGLDDGKPISELSSRENRTIDSVIRQVNDQLTRRGKPKFFVSQKKKNSLTQKNILVSSTYKKYD